MYPENGSLEMIQIFWNEGKGWYRKNGRYFFDFIATYGQFLLSLQKSYTIKNKRFFMSYSVLDIANFIK